MEGKPKKRLHDNKIERSPTSSPLGNQRTPPPPVTWQLKRWWRTRWLL